MNLTLRLAAVAVATAALVGCGGAPIASKEEAAAVAYGAGDRSSKGAVMRIFQSGIDGSGKATATCTNGGQVSVVVDASSLLSGGGSTLNVAYEVHFDGCTEPVWDDPKTEAVEREDVVYDGHTTMTLSGSATSTGASFALALKGKLELGGAVRDTVEMDITQTASASASGASVTIDGTITTSSETYLYENETFVVAAASSP